MVIAFLDALLIIGRGLTSTTIKYSKHRFFLCVYLSRVGMFLFCAFLAFCFFFLRTFNINLSVFAARPSLCPISHHCLTVWFLVLSKLTSQMGFWFTVFLLQNSKQTTTVVVSIAELKYTVVLYIFLYRILLCTWYYLFCWLVPNVMTVDTHPCIIMCTDACGCRVVRGVYIVSPHTYAHQQQSADRRYQPSHCSSPR